MDTKRDCVGALLCIPIRLAMDRLENGVRNPCGLNRGPYRMHAHD